MSISKEPDRKRDGGKTTIKTVKQVLRYIINKETRLSGFRVTKNEYLDDKDCVYSGRMECQIERLPTEKRDDELGE